MLSNINVTVSNCLCIVGRDHTCKWTTPFMGLAMRIHRLCLWLAERCYLDQVSRLASHLSRRRRRWVFFHRLITHRAWLLRLHSSYGGVCGLHRALDEAENCLSG